MPLTLATLSQPTSSAASFEVNNSVSRIQTVPTVPDVSVGVGRPCSMKTEFRCGIKRRSGSLSVGKDVARRMIFDHLRLMSSLSEIQQTLPRPYFRFFRNCSRLQRDRQTNHVPLAVDRKQIQHRKLCVTSTGPFFCICLRVRKEGIRLVVIIIIVMGTAFASSLGDVQLEMPLKRQGKVR